MADHLGMDDGATGATPDDFVYPHDSDDNELVDLFVDELSSAQLRILLRDHIAWLFIGAGIAGVALVLPSSPWYAGLFRLALFLAGFALGGTRLLQINGIFAELRKRTENARSSDAGQVADDD